MGNLGVSILQLLAHLASKVQFFECTLKVFSKQHCLLANVYVIV